MNRASTGPNDFVEYRFSRPVQNLDYLSASLKNAGSAQVTVQALGSGISRKLSVPTANNTGLRPVKVALHSASAKPFTAVRIYPGKTTSFALQDLKVCRLPQSVLSPWNTPQQPGGQ
ncbi:hypothetical protein [Deinococcus malanensis]|uniref:hypothetical protein n=1 Tax=Deinococcus malanensis TaxID=1706855 RepID=UPI00166EFAF6|nr:hypothetical protein [Deinococcus malanensis]